MEKNMKKKIIIAIIAIMLTIGIAFSLFQISKSRSFQFFGGLVTKVETKEKVVALTFDDGPGVNTDQILNILRKHNVKGTFFLTGKEIEKDLEAAEKIVIEGHEVGNHTYSHERMVLKSPSFIRNEIEKTDELIRKIGYEGDIHVRPPYGKRLLYLPYYLSKHNRKTIFWNIEPETVLEVNSNSDTIANYVVGSTKPGSIILLHVMYESRKESLESVEKIIVSLHEQGYTFTTVSDLLKYNNNKRKKPTTTKVVNPKKPYSVADAIINGDVVSSSSGFENLDKFARFLENVKNNITDTIRITRYTVEGDPIFDNLVFDGKLIHYTSDNTQDGYAGTGAGINTTACKYVEDRKTDYGIEYYLVGCESIEIGNFFNFTVPKAFVSQLKSTDTVIKKVKSQLSDKHKSRIDKDKEVRLSKVLLKEYMGEIKDSNYIGKEVYLLDFTTTEKYQIPNNFIVYASIDKVKIVGYGYVD
jgi:chitin deacetylase